MLAHVPSFRQNPRGSLDFLAVVIHILVVQICFISVNTPARELVVTALPSVLEL